MIFKFCFKNSLVHNFSTTKISRIFPPTLPPAIGPYSPATIVNNTIYISGQLPINFQGAIESQEISQQAHQVMKNIKHVLASVNCGFDDIAKTTILLTDMGNFSKVNEIYAQYFESGKYPARACYAVKELPKGSLIEIEAIAYLPG